MAIFVSTARPSTENISTYTVNRNFARFPASIWNDVLSFLSRCDTLQPIRRCSCPLVGSCPPSKPRNMSRTYCQSRRNCLIRMVSQRLKLPHISLRLLEFDLLRGHSTKSSHTELTRLITKCQERSLLSRAGIKNPCDLRPLKA